MAAEFVMQRGEDETWRVGGEFFSGRRKDVFGMLVPQQAGLCERLGCSPQQQECYWASVFLSV